MRAAATRRLHGGGPRDSGAHSDDDRGCTLHGGGDSALESAPMTPVVVITGASSGIGEATARHLAQARDARCVLVARRAERLEQLVADIGGGASFVAVDVTEPDAP